MPSFKIGKDNGAGGVPGTALRICLRFFQFVLALTVAGLYGVDLDHARKAGAYMDGKWVFAEVTAGLSAITCLVYLIPFLHSYMLFAWDFVIFVLWAAVFGIFGKIYIPAHPTPMQKGQIRMKHAVWVDLACFILWFITTIYSTFIFLGRRRSQTLHTGRGDMKA